MASSVDGYNPLRWNCDKGGPGKNCFNRLRRPKIEVFADCFPGRISFGDVDGIVEINGYGLMLEWKAHNRALPKGQQIMYERLTISGLITVICVVGNAETMECTHYSIFSLGRYFPPKESDLEGIKEIVRRWVQKTKITKEGQ